MVYFYSEDWFSGKSYIHSKIIQQMKVQRSQVAYTFSVFCCFGELYLY